MREYSVFNFLKNDFPEIYENCMLMEELIYLGYYNTSTLVYNVIKNFLGYELNVPINDDIEFIKKMHADAFNSCSIYYNKKQNGYKIAKVDYEFDFSYFSDNVKISKDKFDDVLRYYIRDNNHNLESIIKELSQIEFVDWEGDLIRSQPNYKIVKTDLGFKIEDSENEFELDDYQKKAVMYKGDKPLLIDAGPGAGKTRVIIERVCFLIKECKVDPSSILVITFTNKAANELKHRFMHGTDLGYSVINQMRISTIHSFCRSLLKDFIKIPYNLLKRDNERNLFFQKHKKELGFEREAFLYNSQSSFALRKFDEYAMFEVDTEGLVNYIEENYPVSLGYLDYIDRFYDFNPDWRMPSMKEIEYLGFADDLYNARYLQIAKAWPIYVEILEREHVCDQNYLLMKAIEILNIEKNLKDLAYKNILIDEFQDTDPLQMQIFEKILSTNYETFTIVGDVDQSIYSFRGAKPEFFTDFAKGDLFENRVLVKNYRSTKDIVEFNEKFIVDERETPKQLEANKDYKMPIFCMENEDKDDESRSIVTFIKNLKEYSKISKYSDVALLFRSHNKKGGIISEFNQQKIPYYLIGINDFIFQDEIKAMLTLFWYIVPQNDYQVLYYGDGGEWLNLLSFTDIYYSANKIFKLTKNTQKILEDIEVGYQREVQKADLEYSKKHEENIKNERSLSKIFKRQDYILDKIYENITKPDLTKLSRLDFKELGITDEHDLNFFSQLNKLKALMENKEVKNRDKPTTLEIYYKLLDITGYLDELFTRSDNDAKKARLNLALLSEIISDFENIMGKHRLNQLFEYLVRSLKYYSCPINELEDNSNKVHIMTVHKSKGLEYPIIITASLKDNSFPLTFDKQSRMGRYDFYNRPNFYTPNEFLKYKPDDIDEEAEEFNKEERRVVYVANTRAEELLLLSTVKYKNSTIPSCLNKFESKMNRIEPYEYNKIKRVKPRKIDNKLKFNQVDFEDVLSYYLFCPLKYDIVSNLRFRNTKNNDKFVESMLHSILEKLHNSLLNDDLDEEDINELISSVVYSYHIPSKKHQDNLRESFNKIVDYWKDYCKHYEIVDYDYSISYEMTHGDLNGKIDLIIKEENENHSLIKFVTNLNNIDNYLDYYLDILSFYGYVLSKEGYPIKNIILHDVSQNKQYVKEFNCDKAKITLKLLDNIVKNIIFNNYRKHTVNCDVCELEGSVCKFNVF